MFAFENLHRHYYRYGRWPHRNHWTSGRSFERLESRAMMAAGGLDATFGGDGIVTTQIGTTSSFVSALAIQPDGGIVAAGKSVGAKTEHDFTLARYRADGTLDNSFGNGGIVTTAMGKKSDAINAIVLQPDGKMVAGGGVDLYKGPSYPFDSQYAFALARYNRDGSLDSSFGTGGKVIHDWNTKLDDSIRDLALQSDGKLVAVGGIADSQRANPLGNMLVARYNAAGKLDTTFGVGGLATIDLGGDEYGFGVVIQPDGKIAVAGMTNVLGTYDFALVRLNANGSRDTSFGNNGAVITDVTTGLARNNRAYDIELQPDGKLVLAGSIEAYSGSVVARYLPNGILDSTFGQDRDANGTPDGITVNHKIENGDSLAIDASGRIVVAGIYFSPDSLDPTSENWDEDFAVARYNSNGTPDLDFGAGGVAQIDVTGTDYDGALAVAVQGDGNIVAGGYFQPSNRYHFALIRLSAEESQLSSSVSSSESLLSATAIDYLMATEAENQFSRKRRRA